MSQKYINTFAPKASELKQGPSEECLKNILNYSKSTEVKKLKQSKMILHLN